MLNDEYNICFLDFETTGSNPFLNDPIEIGAVLVYPDLSIITQFNTYIRPIYNFSSTETAFNIHRLNLNYLQSAPHPKDVLEDFFLKIGTNFRFASWNMNFDVAFFNKICFEYNFTNYFTHIHYRHIDIQSIYNFLRITNHINTNSESLDSCLAYLNFSRPSTHDALNDANLSLLVYKKLVYLYTNQRNDE